MTQTKFKPEDRLQKTWIPEGTVEYKSFKHVTQENKWIADTLKKEFSLSTGDLVLDVGGREGDVALAIQKPEFIHLVDPDPTLKLPFTPALYLREKIQNVDLSGHQYKFVIFGHVLGYLGTQAVQAEVFRKLCKLVAPRGTLALFYNRNTGYMGELLKFSKENLPSGHYDYFDENLFKELPNDEFDVRFEDISFELDYPSYEELARCCWFLFGAMDQDINGIAAKFLPKLKADLSKPAFPIEERLALITRNPMGKLRHETLIASAGASTRLAGSKLSDEEVEQISKSSAQK